MRAFLDKNAKRREPGAGMVYRAGNEDPEFRKKAKDWQAKKADAGYAGITWSKDWGGRGGTPIQQVIYDQEEAKYAVPRGLFDIGLGMCIPTICTWGTQAQRDRFARKALRGEEVWCQLFSEPAAGSDLAGLRTRAERDGDDWVVNGQKIWTSGAHYCDFGVLVTRSDFSAPEAQGPHLLLHRHEVAGHRDPADQADLRASRTSTRCSSPTCASPTASASARSATAGRSR